MKIKYCIPKENKLIILCHKDEISNISSYINVEILSDEFYISCSRDLKDIKLIDISKYDNLVATDCIIINSLEELKMIKITYNNEFVNFNMSGNHPIRIRLRIGNIVDSDGDAVVNAANVHLAAGGGVCGAIFMASGRDGLFEECQSIGWCDPGNCVLTNGYDLKVPYIIHTVGPRYVDPGAPEKLRNAYFNTLKLADGYFMKKISMPSISTGTYKYPVDEAVKIAVDTILSYRACVLEEVEIVCFDFNMYKAFLDELVLYQANDKIKGSLIGGAIGDALGYVVEFNRYSTILEDYGINGITEYKLFNGKAIFSDDTQMTLFTANAIMYYAANKESDGVDLIDCIYKSYLNWLQTQGYMDRNYEEVAWIRDIKELNARRAPGNTCMWALGNNVMGTIENPINDSKGCGGVMRVAPIGLMFKDYKHNDIAMYAAKASAITHGHELGYIPSAMLAHMIHIITYQSLLYPNLVSIINYSLDEIKKMFSGSKYINEFVNLINNAISLALYSQKTDEENIRSLGEGWVAEEALAIAIYCAVKYPNSFDKAIIASVNHNGDSDSTGAICGNILGCYLGDSNINNKWKDKLQLLDVIEEISNDLCDLSLNVDRTEDLEWVLKYVLVSCDR